MNVPTLYAYLIYSHTCHEAEGCLFLSRDAFQDSSDSSSSSSSRRSKTSSTEAPLPSARLSKPTLRPSSSAWTGSKGTGSSSKKRGTPSRYSLMNQKGLTEKPSNFYGFLKAFSILSLNRDIFFRFDECGARDTPHEQQLHLQNQYRRDAQFQRPSCQHRPHQQDLPQRDNRPGHRQQPQGDGRRGGLSGPQPLVSRSSRRSRSRRSRRDGRPCDHPSSGPSAAAGHTDLDRTPGRGHRQHHSNNSDHYCRCNHMSVGVQRPSTVFQEEKRQETGQEGQRYGERQRRQPVGGDRAVDLRLTRRDGPAGPTGRSPPPSYRDVERADSAQPDLRHRLSQRDRPVENDSAARAGAQCSSHGTQERPVPAPPRVVQQRQRPVPYPTSGPPPSQSLGAIPKQVQKPRHEPPRYEQRQLLPLVDCDKSGGFDRQGPQLILDAHPPGPCEGALTIVANNSHRTSDKNQRYCYQRLYMPNRHAAGTVLFVGCETFLDRNWPPAVVNPANERRPGDRAPAAGAGPPPIPAFEPNNRHAAATDQPAAASTKDVERESPIYEKIIDDVDDTNPGDSGKPASIVTHGRRQETDGPGSPTVEVDLCSDDNAAADATN